MNNIKLSYKSLENFQVCDKIELFSSQEHAIDKAKYIVNQYTTISDALVSEINPHEKLIHVVKNLHKD